MKKSRHRLVNGILILFIAMFAAVAGISAQDGYQLGMEPTPKNLRESLNGASASAGRKELPARVDLSEHFPEPGYQGNINSCTGWATAYACKSYQEKIEQQWSIENKETIFSPSYVYNQINGGRDQGASLIDAVDLVVQKGCSTLESMPYTENYRTTPDRYAHAEAKRFKADSYRSVDPSQTAAVKRLLAEGHCVIIGMDIYQNFMNYRGGTYNRASGSYLGGHAMTVLGYDDSRNAFRLINSWGSRWGDGGYAWVDYGLFGRLTKTAMVLYDQVENTPDTQNPPSGITASAGTYPDKIRVSWEPVKNAESYRVYRAGGSPSDFEAVAAVRGTTYLDNSAQTGKRYFYSITSTAAGRESEYSPVVRGWLKEVPREIGAPQGLIGRLEGDSVLLRWETVPEVSGYYIYRWDEEVEEYRRIGRSSNAGFRDQRAAEGGPGIRRYIVTAFQGKTEGSASTVVTVLIEKGESPKPPAPPKVISASQGEYQRRIVIKWEAVEGADSYRILKWSEKNGSWIELAETPKTYYEDRYLRQQKARYAVVTLKDGLESESSSYVRGWVQGTEEPEEPQPYDDSDYFDDYNKEEEEFFEDENFFSDDSFFTDEEEFFTDFEQEDFFFGDEEAFFAVDEKEFFGEDDDFF
ncbi:MAG: hypothetical protein K9L68_08665 [Spirochaetales bacterium]|nr:hypothetical protein [Spirochaetales bacterium]MCF7938657.1 hypothetical protein [Spirochaetales bacterium]